MTYLYLCLPPRTQIEALVGRLGDIGIEAIAQTIEPLSEINETEQVTNAGNLFGTLS